jgi:type IV pilus assembly protein PilM
VNQLISQLRGYGGRILRPLLATPQSNRLAALDINNYQIKLAVLHRDKGHLTLEAIHVGRVEGEADSSKITQAHVEELQWLVKEHDLKGCGVIVSLPYSSYTTRLVVLPRMPRKELYSAIKLDLSNHTKTPAEDALVDYVTVDSFTQEDAQYENHLVVAVDRQPLEDHVAALGAVGLKIQGFSVPPLALRNLINVNKDLPRDAVYAVINLSNEETTFSIIERGKLLFTREIPRTSDELTDALRTIVIPGGETVHLSHERAQEIKYEYGIIDDSLKGETTDEGIALEHVAVMMRPVLEKMLVEIRRSIDFCQEQFGVDPPEKVFLSGGGAKLLNLSSYLGSRLRLPVEFIIPAAGFNTGDSARSEALQIHRLSLASALGMALNILGGKQYFTPVEFIQPDYRYARMAMRLTAAASVLVAASSIALAGLSVSQTNSQLESRRTTIERLTKMQQEYREEADRIKLRRFRRDALLSMIGPEVRWGSLLKDLSHRVSMDVQLNSMQELRTPIAGHQGLVEHRVRFKGLISLRRHRLETITSDLLEEMTASPYLDDVRLETVKAVDDEVATVEVSCKLLF